MEVIIIKKTKQNRKWLRPSSEPIEIDNKIAKGLIEKGIAKSTDVKVATVKNEEVEKLETDLTESENKNKTLDNEVKKLKKENKDTEDENKKLKELLKVSIGLSKDKVPDGAESYVKVDLTK